MHPGEVRERGYVSNRRFPYLYTATHLSLRKHEPDNRQRLEGVVHGQEVEDDVDERFDEVEEAKDDPVGKPGSRSTTY